MKPKKPRPRKPRERPDLRRLAAPPPADFYCLDMGDTLVTLYGADLRIESFAGKRLIAAGRFARIELRSKWEVPQE